MDDAGGSHARAGAVRWRARRLRLGRNEGSSPPPGASMIQSAIGERADFDARPSRLSLSQREVCPWPTEKRTGRVSMRAIRLLLSVLAQHPTARIDRGQLGPCGASRHSPNTPPCVVVSLGG